MHEFQNLPQLSRQTPLPLPRVSQPSLSSRDKVKPPSRMGRPRPSPWTVVPVAHESAATGRCAHSQLLPSPKGRGRVSLRPQLPAPLRARSPHNCICNPAERLASCQVSCHLRFQLKHNEINTGRNTSPSAAGASGAAGGRHRAGSRLISFGTASGTWPVTQSA